MTDVFGRPNRFHSQILRDIINLANSKISNPSSQPITASSFIRPGGQSNQYMMADGSVSTTSGSNSSNIYLYNNSTATTSSPSSGQLRYNNIIQDDATELYISHLTRDGIDIDEFLSLITDLSIIYIQDQNSSINCIKYTVVDTPTIILNDYITIPVLCESSSGTGSTTFTNDQDIFMSVFTNQATIDLRISAVEEKTQNQTAVANSTTFTGKINNLFIKDNSIASNIIISNGINNCSGNQNIVLSNGMSNCPSVGNVCIGYNTMRSLDTGRWNTSVGLECQDSLVSGSYNVSIGATSSRLNVSGEQNVAVGLGSLYSNLGSQIQGVGVYAGANQTTITNTTAIGYFASPTQNNQVVLGNAAVTEVKSAGAFNGAGFKTPTGLSSEVLNADGGITSATNVNTVSTIVKRDVNGAFSCGKINNLFIKDNSIATNIIISNGTNNTGGTLNTVIGNGMPNTTNSGNVAVGWDSMPLLTTGTWNCSVGFTSGASFTSGSYNCNMGCNSNRLNYTGSNNTAIGINSLQSNTASNNTALGYSAGNLLTTITNTTCLGANSQASSSNQVILGNSAITEVKSTGVFTSSLGFKTSTGTSGDILLADGTTNSSIITKLLSINTDDSYVNYYLCFNPSAALSNNSGYFPTTAMLNIGSVSTLVSQANTNYFTKIFRINNPTSSVGDGQKSGYMGTSTFPKLWIGSGFVWNMNFAISDTNTSVNSICQMFCGLHIVAGVSPLFSSSFGPNTAPSILGIGCDIGDSVLSFYNKGTATTNPKIATSFSVSTPSTTWFNITFINVGGSNDVRIILNGVSSTGVSTTQIQDVTLTGTTSIVNTAQIYPICVRAMGTPGITGSAQTQFQKFSLFLR